MFENFESTLKKAFLVSAVRKYPVLSLSCPSIVANFVKHGLNPLKAARSLLKGPRLMSQRDSDSQCPSILDRSQPNPSLVQRKLRFQVDLNFDSRQILGFSDRVDEVQHTVCFASFERVQNSETFIGVWTPSNRSTSYWIWRLSFRGIFFNFLYRGSGTWVQFRRAKQHCEKEERWADTGCISSRFPSR
jgi:hypothetical protein